jgi:predicted transcriptional regulator
MDSSKERIRFPITVSIRRELIEKIDEQARVFNQSRSRVVENALMKNERKGGLA